MNKLRPLPFALDPNPQDPAAVPPMRRSLQRRAPAPLALEQRIMFDGATVDAVVRAAADNAAATAAADGAHADTGERSLAPAALAPAVPAVRGEAKREIVFIEDNLPDYLKLADSARATAQVVVLDHTQDGLQQMIASLQGREVDAIHLVTHGANGQVDLGSTRLSVSNVDGMAGQLAQLGQSLSAGGDLLLYGCDVAGGAGGDFLASLAQHTGADVAASADTTGSSGFGNWTLEAHSGNIDTAARSFDSAGWQGELATTVFDAQQRQLVFAGAVAEKAGSTGVNNNDVMRFRNVITVGGQAIDAIVTTTTDRIVVSSFDSTSSPSSAAEAAKYFQPLTKVDAGGSVSFKFDFVLAGTTTGVTLQNFVVNSYDIDSSGDSKPDRQFQEFKGFARYELARNTQLTPTVREDGSVTFEYNAATSKNNTPDLYADPYRVQVYYDSASSLVIRSGANGYQGATFSAADAHFSLEFQLRAWGGPTDIVGSPAANLVYSNTTFNEAAADGGSITSTSTITLNNGVFAGTNGQALDGVNFLNKPAGLDATVVRTSDTTAVLRFTGAASAHANANDVANFGVSFGNAAFVGGNAGAVTGATRSDLVINFSDDTTAPSVAAGQAFSYAENRAANTVIGTVAASDAAGVTGFRFVDSGTNESEDRRFTIDAGGTIRLSATGVSGFSNDFETLPNGFTYAVQARDLAGNWSTARDVTLNLTNLDDTAPSFSSGSAVTVNENQNLLYTAQGADSIDYTNRVISYALEAGGDAGLLQIDSATGAVRLASGSLDAETRASYSFTVRAVDASGNARQQAVTVNVANIDEVAPAFTSGASARVDENQNLLYTAQALDDVDYTNRVVTYALEAGGDAGLLRIDAATGAVRLADGNLDFETKSSYSFTVNAFDAGGNVRQQAVTVDVANLDDAAPVFASGSSATVNENQDLLYTAQAQDGLDATDGVVAYALEAGGDAGLLQIDSSSGAVRLASGNLDFESKSSYSFTVRAVDASGNASLKTVTVAVANIDELAPAFTSPASATANENQNLLYTAQAGDNLDYTDHAVSYALAASGDVALLHIDSATGAVRLADGNLNFEAKASYRFTVVARDASGNAGTQAVTVAVADLNEAPTAAGDSVSTLEDTPLAGQLPGYADPDGDHAGYVAVTQPQHGSLQLAADGSYTYTPAPDFFGADGFTYAIDDGRGGRNAYRVDIAVVPVNDAPVAGADSIHTAEDTAASGSLPGAVDAEGDPVTWSVETGPAKGELVLNDDGSYTYTPHANVNGSDSFVYRVSDGSDATLHTVTIDVDAVNDAPVAGDAAIVTLEDTAYPGQLPAATDADGDPVGYALAGGPAHGQVTIAQDGRYVYTPAADYHGSDSFTYRVGDGQGGANVYTVGVTVNAVNDAPTAADAAFATAEDVPYAASLPTARDIDRDPVTYALAEQAAHGSVSIGPDGRFTYTPAADYNGADRFRYSVSDGQGGVNVYTVQVTVAPVNDAPLAGPGLRAGAELGLPMAPVTLAPFTDIDSGSGSITYDASLADGAELPSWLHFDPVTLELSGTPPAGALGTLEIVVRGSDGQLAATTAVTLTVGNPPAPGQSAAIERMTLDTGSSQLDFITADGAAGRSVTGTIDAPLGRNEVLQVSFDGGASWTAATLEGSAWQATDPNAHEAGWTIVTRVTNTVAGLSGPETVREVILDREAPGAPTVDSISTTSVTPTLTGTAVLRAGETLNVSVNGQLYTVPVEDGRWTLDLATATPRAPLVEGRSYDVVATVVDAAGNRRSGATDGVVSVSAPVVAQVPAAPSAAPAPAPDTVAAAPTPVAPPAPVPAMRESVVPGSVVGSDTLLLGSGVGTRTALDFANVLRGAELSDIYTRSEGFRTVVAKAEEPALVLFQGVPDQFVDANASLSMTIPADAFAHTQPKAIVRLAAVLQDGRPLPTWVQFNGQTGQFTGEVPKGLTGELRIKLIARDLNGREAVALFRINVGETRNGGDAGDAAASKAGKAGLSERLGKAGQGRAATLRGR